MADEIAAPAEELIPYNIIPLDCPDEANHITSLPEVHAAISSLEYFEGLPALPGDFQKPATRNADLLDYLQHTFGFQKDSVSNQRENIVILLANEQCRLDTPVENEAILNEEAVTNVFDKTVQNYVHWCSYLSIGPFWNRERISEGQLNIPKERKILFFSLYYLIWGEAANVRHLPECLCYIFHRMGEELMDILEGIASQSKSCVTADDGVSFLDNIIQPIYDVIAKEAKIKIDERKDSQIVIAQPNNEAKVIDVGKIAHLAWRNYDDFNEYFWSPACLEDLSWPLNRTSSFFSMPLRGSTVRGKTSFVENRTFLHLYHSFHRMWIFYVMIFQGLVIIAWNDGQLNSKTLHEVLGIGRTYFAMKLFQSVLDICLKYGAYRTTKRLQVERMFVRVLWFLFATAFICSLYMNGLQEKTSSSNSASTILTIYTTILIIYAGTKHHLSKWALLYVSDWDNDTLVARFALWIRQEDCYVGRDLNVATTDYIWYTSIWVFILGLNFAVSYLVLISPLVIASKLKIDEPKNIHDVLAISSLWLGAFCMYLLGFYIIYTIVSGFAGYIVGEENHIGQINCWEDFSERFDTYPAQFMDNLHIRTQNDQVVERNMLNDAKNFSYFWNEMLEKLREEDYIHNEDREKLEMPRNSDDSVSVIQWPLFLLIKKLHEAQGIATTMGLSQGEKWEQISRDRYMKYAVQESYQILKLILTSVFDDQFQDVFAIIDRSINEGNIHTECKLSLLYRIFPAMADLIKSMYNDDTDREIYENYINFTREIKDFPTKSYDRTNVEALREIVVVPEAQRSRIERLYSIIFCKQPKPNAEARRRLQFFTNSLFMSMPDPKPVSKMLSFSVLTPFFDETVLYSKSELISDIRAHMNLFFYLTGIFTEEWDNFRARNDITTFDPTNADPVTMLKVRFWASYHGQTLARTVRGTMYNLEALKFQSRRENMITGATSTRANRAKEEAYADLKFTYIVACQNYGEQKKRLKEVDVDIADDIALLLERNQKLRVAFIDKLGEGTNAEFNSKLVKCTNQEEKVVYSIKLPGDPILGEGKPENQNNAIIFTRGYAVQTIDMNQDNYFEETLKMRNLLEEFCANDHDIDRATILGIREHIFTGRASSLASFMSQQETSFVTLGQRVLANPLKVRMHYGHPDVFDRVFHITRGGISKASKGINISEDIYAGYNSTLRQGNITHHEYIQVGKGRDVGFNQIAKFEAKVAGGNGEQVLSRDVYRLGQQFDFFRMLSLYFTTVGYYFSTLLVVITVYMLLYAQLILALSETSVRTQSINIVHVVIMLLSVLYPTLYLINGSILEHGLKMAARKLIVMLIQLGPVFFIFSLGTRMHWFGKTILHGGAKYTATGRGFVMRHTDFIDNYKRHSRSHFVKAMELYVLMYGLFWIQEATIWSYLQHVFSVVILASSWLSAPFLFDPSCFVPENCKKDKREWQNWLNGTWEEWWKNELSDIQTFSGRVMQTILSLRFFIFTYVVYKRMDVSWEITSWLMHGGCRGLLIVAFIFWFKIWETRRPPSVICQWFFQCTPDRLCMLAFVAVFAAVLPPTYDLLKLSVFILAFILTVWGILSICVAWKSVLENTSLWNSVMSLALVYDAIMGHIILFSITQLSRFTCITRYQSRLMFEPEVAEGIIARDVGAQAQATENQHEH